jgi:DNA polymerase (family 10)
LSEYGIKKLKKMKDKKIKSFDNEEKFYNAIGLTWIPPELREDQGEIELAQKINYQN